MVQISGLTRCGSSMVPSDMSETFPPHAAPSSLQRHSAAAQVIHFWDLEAFCGRLGPTAKEVVLAL